MKRISLLALFVVLTANTSFAAPTGMTTFQADESQKTIIKELEQSVYRIIHTLNAYSGSRLHPREAEQVVRSHILPLFDFDMMVRSIIGNSKETDNIWLKNAIKHDIITTIMQNLHRAKQYHFVPTGMRTMYGNIILSFKVRGMNIDLMMHNTSGKWQIIDVFINNYGLIQYYQQKFIRR